MLYNMVAELYGEEYIVELAHNNQLYYLKVSGGMKTSLLYGCIALHVEQGISPRANDFGACL